MTWPSGPTGTTNLDSGADSPAAARADLLDLTQKVNLIIAHVSGYIQGLLDDANVATARSTLGLGALATKATIATGDIDAAAVTYAKIQNVSATDKLLGRVTARAGDIEEIPLTAAGRALIDDADAAAQRATLGGIALLNSPPFTGTPTRQSGTGSGTGSLVSLIHQHVSAAGVGNTSGTGFRDLMTFTVPANTLGSGRLLRIKGWGSAANNANGKTIGLLWDGLATVILPITVNQGSKWEFESIFDGLNFYTKWTETFGNTLQKIIGPDISNSQFNSLTADQAFKVVLSPGGTAGANDVVQNGLLIELLSN